MGDRSLPDFSIRRGHRNGVLRLTVAGDLDMSTAPELERALRATTDQGTTGVLVDLEPLTFLDAAGLRVLLSGASRACADGCAFALVGVSPVARKVLRITETERVLADEVTSAALLARFEGREAGRGLQVGAPSGE